MTRTIIGVLVVLSALVSPLARGIPPSVAIVNIDLGTVYSGSGSGGSCAVPSAGSLPANLDQTTTYRTSGQVTFDRHATTVSANGGVAVCVNVTYNLSAYGTFSGSETIAFQGGYTTTVNVTGRYLYGTWTGAILPKYQVLGVDYAPPGSRSSVTYSASFMRGGSTSITSSFTNQYSVSVSESQKFGIGILHSKLSFTINGSYAQEADKTTGSSWSIQTVGGDIIPGPAGSVVGIDHDYDIVWVWLNPAVNLTLTGPASISWDGYAYNPADPANEMDVLYLYVYELKDPSRIPANVAARLARSWDQSGVGGLNAADYASILAADPFATNPAFDPNADTTGRFTLEVGQTFNFEPAAPGGQPVTETFTSTAQNTATTGSGAQDTRSVGITIDDSLSGGIFGTKLGLALKASYTYTSTTKWSSTNTTTTGQTAALSITGPLASDNYTGPTAIQIWRDNVYGSYMFFGVE